MRFRGYSLALQLFLIEQIMQEIEFPKFKDYKNQRVNFIQPKLDGHLTKIRKSESGLWQAYTKNDYF